MIMAGVCELCHAAASGFLVSAPVSSKGVHPPSRLGARQPVRPPVNRPGRPGARQPARPAGGPATCPPGRSAGCLPPPPPVPPPPLVLLLLLFPGRAICRRVKPEIDVSLASHSGRSGGGVGIT